MDLTESKYVDITVEIVLKYNNLCGKVCQMICVKKLDHLKSFTGDLNGTLKNCTNDECKITSMDTPAKVQVYFTVGSRYETALFNSNTPIEQLRGTYKLLKKLINLKN